MHFDLNSKSLTMSGFKKYSLSFISAHSMHIHSTLPRNGHQMTVRYCNYPPPMRLGGLGERLSFPQRVRAEPGRQTFLMHLWPENEVWERLNSLNRLLAKLVANMHFDLNLKSLTMSGFKIPSLILLCPLHAHPFPLPFPTVGTKLRREIVFILPHCS